MAKILQAGTCQICYEETLIQNLPCCSVPGYTNTNFYCKPCINQMVNTLTSSCHQSVVSKYNGKLFNCPICKSALIYEETKTSENETINKPATLADNFIRPKGFCHNGGRFGEVDLYHINPEGCTSANQCHGCFVAAKYSPFLKYQCKKCGNTQSIKYPMFLSAKKSPAEFSGVSWACHNGYSQGCEYEMWRLVKEDIKRIEYTDWLPDWPTRQTFLENLDDNYPEMEIPGLSPGQSQGGTSAEDRRSGGDQLQGQSNCNIS